MPIDAIKSGGLRHFGSPPSLAEIEELARRVFAELPAAFAAQCGSVAIQVEEFADEETLTEMKIEDPFDLAGLYRGAPLTEKSGQDVVQSLDMVLLYRRALLDWWAEDEMEFEDLVRHVLVHEIGHHFGFSDDDMEAIEDRAEG